MSLVIEANGHQLSRARRAIGSWQVLVADQESAAGQMAMDEQLAEQARPTVRWFRWQAPAMSLGFKQPCPDWMDRVLLASYGIELVERPTGGGVAVHGSDLSCSVVVPHDARLPLTELMGLVCESLANGVRTFGIAVQWLSEVERSSRVTYCLAEESPYALMVEGRKLCGLAIRRCQTSWLLQGSMLVRALPEVFTRVMPAAVSRAFQARAIALEEAAGRPVADEELLAAMVRAWRATWGVPCFWTSQESSSKWEVQSSKTKPNNFGLHASNFALS